MKGRFAVAASLCVLLTLLVGCSSDTAAQTQPGPSKSGHVPVVAFLGDSYTAGIHDTTRDETYASITARMLGWQVIVAGQAGTGLIAPGRDGNTFAHAYTQQLAWRPPPDMVVVVGGHNDWPYPPSLERASATRLLNKIRQRWPKTHLMLIGPMWGSGEPRPEILDVRDALKTTAGQEKVPFIDPLAQGWVTGKRDEPGSGNAPRYILPDHTHPNAQGHQYFAQRFVTDLRKLRLARPTAGRTPTARPTTG